MSEIYITQESAFAPGIAGEWPKVIAKPDNPNGRLVKIDRDMNAKCIECQTELTPVFDGINQYEDALEIMLTGGYGMYYDKDYDMIGEDVYFSLCKNCADKLLKDFPNIRKLIDKSI